MEVYTLDEQYRRIDVIDKFESLIWTERFKAYGDFELVMPSSRDSRNLLKTGTRLAMNESYRMMTVETFEDDVDSDGQRLLTVKGRSIEAILDDRGAKQTMSNLTTEPKWIITGAPAVVARKIFHDICVLGTLDPADILPDVIEGSIMPPSTIAEPVDPITVELDPTTVYAAIKDICDVWNLGFRLLRNFDTGDLYFDIYAGSDRTTAQTTLPPVIFSPDLDNLQNTSELTTISGAKNVAYVFSPAGFQVVYAPNVDPEQGGFDRHVLVVKADDITADNPDVAGALLQKGKEELAKSAASSAFDGEIAQWSQYKYGTHYQLGDLVEMRNLDGVTNNMRIEEQIFVSDKEGERSYPTLALNTFINSGSWLSWNFNKRWGDFDADTTTVWSSLP
jgi:hypothetical protein